MTMGDEYERAPKRARHMEPRSTRLQQSLPSNTVPTASRTGASLLGTMSPESSPVLQPQQGTPNNTPERISQIRLQLEQQLRYNLALQLLCMQQRQQESNPTNNLLLASSWLTPTAFARLPTQQHHAMPAHAATVLGMNVGRIPALTALANQTCTQRTVPVDVAASRACAVTENGANPNGRSHHGASGDIIREEEDKKLPPHLEPLSLTTSISALDSARHLHQAALQMTAAAGVTSPTLPPKVPGTIAQCASLSDNSVSDHEGTPLRATNSRKRSRDASNTSIAAHNDDRASASNPAASLIASGGYIEKDAAGVQSFACCSNKPHGLGKMVPLALGCDKEVLTKYQALIREHVVLFEVTLQDLQRSAQGRNKPIEIGQVGVLCKHCAMMKPADRPSGSCYFPSRMGGIYQAVQNMVSNHFLINCPHIPVKVRERIRNLKLSKKTLWGGGRQYWIHGAKMSGVVECDDYLTFADSTEE